MRTLSVPATSAPVERVFSHGGIIMCPHRAQLSDKLLGGGGGGGGFNTYKIQVGLKLFSS